MTSSLSRHVASGDILDTQEQSGWTYYLEDFSLDKRENSSNSDESFCSPSLVSDAASYAAWKTIIFDKNRNNDGFSSLHPSEFPKRLNFDKQKRKRISYEDDLEDTASSPDNSPKVSRAKQKDMDLKRHKESIGNLLEKHTGSYRTVEKSSINHDAKAGNYDWSELRKRGLCRVPLSMLLSNYLQ